MDIIFDVDGTLLDITHRLHFLKLRKAMPNSERANPSNGKRWKEFRDPKLKALDKPIIPVIDVLLALHVDHRVFHNIIIVSGRTRSEEFDTKNSLRSLIPFINALPFYMRSEKDYRPDTEMKLTALEKMRKDGYDPIMAFEDRPSVVRMWRKQGILVADVGEGIDF